MLSIIVAQARNRAIGKGNDLPWYLSDDLKRFKQITTGHTVIMGRKTFDSVLARLGKPLPNRTNIIITRDKTYKAEGATVVHSLDKALAAAGTDAIVIGGAEIYSQALPKVDRLYITEIDADVAGDVYFPELVPEEWEEVSREHHAADAKHQFAFDWVVLERKK